MGGRASGVSFGETEAGKTGCVIVFFFCEYENSQKVRYCFPEEKKGAYKTAETKLLENMQIGLMDETSRQVPGYFGSALYADHKRKFAENAGLYFDET